MKKGFVTKITTLLSVVTLLMVVGCGVKTQMVSTETLLKEMVDKRDVTYFPEHYYTTKQFSSYDRDSDRADTSHYSWFANDDRSQFLRQDTIDGRVENVMYDAEGPGAITRWWITVAGEGAKEGTIRVYIDGSEEPVMEGEALEFIGYNKGVGYPLSSALSEGAYELNRGHNLYMPIPYSKHCKVTYECEYIVDANTFSQQFYYNINYRTYDENTIVESFTANTLDSLKTLIEATNKALLVPDSFAVENETKTEDWSVVLKPSQVETTSIEVENSALSQISINLKADDIEQALRSTILKMSFDGSQTVWCPVGDFFGTGHAMRDSKTWRTEVDSVASTLTSTWVMPFREGCVVTVENLGEQEIAVDMEFTQCDYDWSNSSMYFGSSWHQYTDISTGKNNKQMDGKGDTMMDLNFVNLQGMGVFVGDALSVYNTADPAWNAWWGEGDEKIYVDGETFPSHFGTGTEDYYGYAWCRPEEFIHPFVSQPIGEGNLTPGHTVNSRFRALDVIPFKSSLRFDMELWHWSGVKVNYAPTTFYYMLPRGVANIAPDVENAKVKIPVVAKGV